jgi:glyceraldehyde-3-phosphate dehydrogenase (NADP+)
MSAMEMLIGGRWQPAIGTRRSEDVTSPYDGSLVGTVPVAGPEDVEAADSGPRADARASACSRAG